MDLWGRPYRGTARRRTGVHSGVWQSGHQGRAHPTPPSDGAPPDDRVHLGTFCRGRGARHHRPVRYVLANPAGDRRLCS